jgi:hypothetical protein
MREVRGGMWESEDDMIRRIFARWSHLVQCRECGGPIDTDLACQECGAKSVPERHADLSEIESELEFWTVGVLSHIDA